MLILQPGEEPVPGYRLKEFLGEGLFGKVWKARGPGDVSVALKFIDLGAKVGLKELRGVKRVKDIRDRNLLSIFGLWLLDHEGHVLGEDVLESLDPTKSAAAVDFHKTLAFSYSSLTPAVLVVAMQLADKTLSDRNKECKAEGQAGIPVKELLRYMEDAARGIDYLNEPIHDLGDDRLVSIRHCDVKPGNIVLVGRSAAVCDFGLARIQSDDIQRTTTGAAGTPAYMAPECIEKGEPSETSDQYALAVTYFELRTGQLPFAAEDQSSAFSILRAHTDGRLMLSALPEAEQAVIRRATARLPDQRYASCQEMVDELRRAVSGDAQPRPVQRTESITKDGTIVVERARDKGVMGTLIAPHKVFERDTDSEVAETLVTPQESREAEARPSAGFTTPSSAAPRRSHRTGLIFGGLVALAVACVVWIVLFPNGKPTVSSSSDDLELIRQIQEQIAAGQFDKTLEGVSRLQDDRARTESEQMVLEGWRKAARGQWTEGKPEVALSTIGRIRDHWPDDPTTLALRLEILNSLIDQAEDELKPEQVDAAGLARIEQTLRSVVLGELGEATAAGEPETARQAWLALARTDARSENWIEVRKHLQEVAPLETTSDQLTELTEEQKTHFIALRTLMESKDPDAPRLRILQDLVALASLQSHRDTWERGQLDDLRDAMLKKWNEESPQGTLSREEEGLALKVWPNLRFDLKLAEADELRGLGEFDEARTRLVEAESMVNQFADETVRADALRRVGSYRAMVELDDEKVDDAQALRVFRSVASVSGTPRLKEIGDALQRRVAGKRSLMDQAIDCVVEIDQPPNSDELRPTLQGLLLTRVKATLEHGEPAQGNLNDFYAQLRHQSEEAEKHCPDDPVVNACLVECAIVEQEATLRQRLPVPRWAETMQRIPKAINLIDRAPDEQWSDYVEYVGALVRFFDAVNPDPLAAAKSIRRVGVRGTTGVVFRVPKRCQLAAEILLTATTANLQRDRKSKIWDPAFAPADAKSACQDLELAERLLDGTEVAQELQQQVDRIWALAAYWRPDKDLDLAARLAENALLSGDKYDGQLLYVSAAAHRGRFTEKMGREDRDRAIIRYAQIVNAISKSDLGNDDYENLIKPALELLASSSEFESDAAKMAAAALLAAKGYLLRENVQLQLSTEDPIQRSYEAYQDANRLDSENSKYVVGMGMAVVLLPTTDETKKIEELNRLAASALDLEPEQRTYETLGFAGNVAVMTSRSQADSRIRKSELNKAIEYYTNALAGQPPETMQAQYLVGRSSAYLEHAFLVQDSQQKESLLTKAIEDATEATKIDERPWPEEAWNAKGNALEDIALYLRKDEAQYYKDAIDCFNRAKGFASADGRSPSKSLLNMGRCRYRSAVSGALPGGDQLGLALSNLGLAMTESVRDSEKAEISIWQSKVHLQSASQQPTRQSYEQADATAQKGAELAKKVRAFTWADFQQISAETAATWAIAAIKDPALLPLNGSIDSLLSTARKRAEEIRTQAKNGTVHVRPDVLLRAARICVWMAEAKGFGSYVSEVDIWLDQLQDLATDPNYPILLILRLERARRTAESQTKWADFHAKYGEDIIAATAEIDRLPKESDRYSEIDAECKRVVALGSYCEYTDAADLEKKREAAIKASKNLYDVVQVFDVAEKKEKARDKSEQQNVTKSFDYRLFTANVNKWLIQNPDPKSDQKELIEKRLIEEGKFALEEINDKNVDDSNKYKNIALNLKAWFKTQ